MTRAIGLTNFRGAVVVDVVEGEIALAVILFMMSISVSQSKAMPGTFLKA